MQDANPTLTLSTDVPGEHHEQGLVQVDHERLVRRAAPGFVPRSRWRDPAFWSVLIGPLVGLGFLGYFAEQVARATLGGVFTG